MRTLLIAGLLAFSAGALAQNPAPQKSKARQQQDQNDQKELRQRIRADGAAGGTAPVPPEKREAVNADAGPHLHETAPSPSKLPRDEPVQPPK